MEPPALPGPQRERERRRCGRTTKDEALLEALGRQLVLEVRQRTDPLIAQRPAPDRPDSAAGPIEGQIEGEIIGNNADECCIDVLLELDCKCVRLVPPPRGTRHEPRRDGLPAAVRRPVVDRRTMEARRECPVGVRDGAALRGSELRDLTARRFLICARFAAWRQCRRRHSRRREACDQNKGQHDNAGLPATRRGHQSPLPNPWGPGYSRPGGGAHVRRLRYSRRLVPGPFRLVVQKGLGIKSSSHARPAELSYRGCAPRLTALRAYATTRARFSRPSGRRAVVTRGLNASDVSTRSARP